MQSTDSASTALCKLLERLLQRLLQTACRNLATGVAGHSCEVSHCTHANFVIKGSRVAHSHDVFSMKRTSSTVCRGQEFCIGATKCHEWCIESTMLNTSCIVHKHPAHSSKPTAAAAYRSLPVKIPAEHHCCLHSEASLYLSSLTPTSVQPGLGTSNLRICPSCKYHTHSVEGEYVEQVWCQSHTIRC